MENDNIFTHQLSNIVVFLYNDTMLQEKTDFSMKKGGCYHSSTFTVSMLDKNVSKTFLSFVSTLNCNICSEVEFAESCYELSLQNCASSQPLPRLCLEYSQYNDSGANMYCCSTMRVKLLAVVI